MHSFIRMNCRFLLFLFVAPVSISIAQHQGTNSWGSVRSEGKGTITVYWYESKPFIYRNANGQMRGIEPEIMEGFKKYLQDTYRVALQILWTEGSSFGDTYATIKDKKEPGTFGISAFSITPERQREVGFGPPYMSDISVLIASNNIPIVGNSPTLPPLPSRVQLTNRIS